MIFELQQFEKKSDFSPQEIPTGKNKGCREFSGLIFFHFLYRKRKHIGQKALCIFNFSSLLIAFALKLICIFIWMCLGCTELCVQVCVGTYVCVCINGCVMNTFGSIILFDIEIHSFAP